MFDPSWGQDGLCGKLPNLAQHLAAGRGEACWESCLAFAQWESPDLGRRAEQIETPTKQVDGPL